MAKKKIVSVLSTAAVGSLIATAMGTTALAKVDGLVVKNAEGVYLNYDLEQLKGSLVQDALGNEEGALLYNDFSEARTTGSLVSYHDDKVGFVDGEAVKKAATDAVLAGTDFELNTFTESSKETVLPETVYNAKVEDGKVVKGDELKPNGQQGEFKVESVSAITDTKLSVKLSSAVDEAKAENFKIEGMTVVAAELLDGKKEVKLEVAGAEVNKEYTVVATGLKVDGKVIENSTFKFTMPPAESLFTPEVTMKDPQLKADGQSSTLVTFTLKNSNGEVMKDADKVEVAFTTTFGRLAEKRVAVQNGIATVLLTSETLDKKQTADITATVVEAANQNLIGLKANRNLLMNPNPEDGIDESVGATMTEVQAAQADRVIVYFNKDVSVEKYTIPGTHRLDKEHKAVANVWRNVANNGDAEDANKVEVVGILPVQGNARALELVLDTTKPLTDNANVKVEFTDKTGTLPVPSTKYCKLTDARKPAMLSVTREGLKTLKVTFSEPVDLSAEQEGNWVIDGYALNDTEKYGAIDPAIGKKAEVGEFNNVTGEDRRNVVTITLGKDTDGNQIYFKSGAHSIQGSSIGDWANLSDIGNNVMNTQTLDFDIPVDNTAPTAKVEVQSPEQYIVTFDKELNEDEAKIKNVVKLEKYNKDTAKWEPETKQTINIKEIINIDNTVQYKVETKQDWTAVYNTKETNQNYYNDSYRLVVEKEGVSSAANGIKNAKMELPLEGAMRTPDVTSPKISSITEILTVNNKPDGTYAVTMSEPVKVSLDGETTADGFETKAQGQEKLPVATAQFIKKDGSKTIDGQVIASPANVYDKGLIVTPVNKDGAKVALEAGEWTIVVRSISDDIGNTAASATENFTVKGESVVEDKFAAVWSFADIDKNFKNNEDADKDGKQDVADEDAGADYVYVKFNKPVSITGDAKSALKTSNYQLNGMPLPTGTQIKANIAGLDDKDTVTDSITIVLPDGYLNGKNTPHVITISEYLESTTAGDKLTNGGAKTLTWTVDSKDLFDASFAAEGKVYSAETAAKQTLTEQVKLEEAEVAVEAAKAAVNALDAKTTGKAALETRVKAVEKTVQDARKAFDAKANLDVAKTKVTELETAAGKDLTIESNLTAAEAAEAAAKTALDKLPAGTEGLAELTTRYNVANKKVTDARTAFDAAKAEVDAVADAKAALTSLAITDETAATATITLPATGSADTLITWKADSTDATGTYTTPARTDVEQTITLTATIKKGNASDTKTFTVTIPSGASGNGAITVVAN